MLCLYHVLDYRSLLVDQCLVPPLLFKASTFSCPGCRIIHGKPSHRFSPCPWLLCPRGKHLLEPYSLPLLPFADSSRTGHCTSVLCIQLLEHVVLERKVIVRDQWNFLGQVKKFDQGSALYVLVLANINACWR